MHIYAGSPFLLWSVRYASSVCCCSAYSIVIFYGHSSSPYSIIVVTRHFVCTTPPRGGPRFVRQDNFAPSRRFREDGLEALKLSSGGGGRQSTNLLLSLLPWRNKRILLIVTLCRSKWSPWYLHSKEDKTVQILEPMWQA